MTEEHALIRAVCADLEDYTTRLVYADWLDEHGHPERAEFLRLSVGWNREVEMSSAPYGWEHLPRLRELGHHPALTPHPSWSGSAPGYPLPWFPTDVQFNSWIDFENNATERFALPHSCWRVRFQTRRKRRWRPKYVRRLVQAEPMIRVLDLDLRSIRGESEGAFAIAASPHVSNLARLHLQGCRVDDRGAMAIAESPALGRLVYLDLTCNPITQAVSNRLRDRFGAGVQLPTTQG